MAATQRTTALHRTKIQSSKYTNDKDSTRNDYFHRERSGGGGVNGDTSDVPIKHPSSTFWYSNEPLTAPLHENDVVPHQPHLDQAGPLPRGSYKRIGRVDSDVKPTCVTSIGLDPLDIGNGNLQAKDIDMDTDSIVSTLHQYIESGFTSFQMVTPPCSTPTRKGMDPTWVQTWTEQSLYGKLLRDTPNSVLNECNLATKIAIPHLEFDVQASGKSLRTMIRERVGDSIRNIYGTTHGCLDTLQVEFRALDHGHGSRHDLASPFTFDVLDVLMDMQREGSIRSISGLNFYSSVLEAADEMGFQLDSNQVSGNLLDPTRYAQDMYPCFNRFKDGDSNTRKIFLSSPLAGGLFHEKFLNVPDAWKNRQGIPIPPYMSKRENRHYTKFRAQKKAPWDDFNKVLKTMADIALKHEVSISSVALRWTIQLDHVGSIVIASRLNSNGDREDYPLRRQRDLREVFSFHLDQEDMDMLWEVTGVQVDRSQKVTLDLEDEMPFDLSDTRFFL